MKTRIVAAAVAAALLAGCSADGTDGAPATIEVFEVVDDVQYYYACGDEVLELPDGRRFFPVLEQERVDPSRYDDSTADDATADDQAMAMVGAMTLAVQAPQPGDDIGTLTVYEDGMAKYVSRRGTTAWLDQQVRTYPWVC